MDCFVARQPIFTTDMKVYGYELLYRDNVSASVSGVEQGAVNGSAATSETILNSFQNIGINKLTQGKRAFVNFTEELILKNVATLLPKDTLVVELLEGILPTVPILEALESLKNAGYSIALDDFIVSPDYYPYFQYADIVKFDFLTTPIDTIRGIAERLQKLNKTLLAEKIENAEIFEEATRMGFTLFQGYYFSKPMTVRQKNINPLRANCFQLMNLTSRDTIDFSRFAKVVKKDVALSYNLLKLVNSAYFGMTQKVKGIQHAISLLGERELSKWVILMSLSRLKDDKPEELVSISLVRGRILEALAEELQLTKHKHDLFLLGLLSLMDMLTDTTMEEVLKEVHLNDFISESLVPGGEYHALLEMLACYEAGEWDRAISLTEMYGLTAERINEEYINALEWVQSLVLL